jgi:hypothetical protein
LSLLSQRRRRAQLDLIRSAVVSSDPMGQAKRVDASHLFY